MSSSEILIKAKYNDTIRRFVYDAVDSSWSNFFAFLSNKFSSSSLINFTVKYYDEEGDLITIDSDHELNSVFEEYCQEGKQIKLLLFTDAAVHAFNKYKTKKEKKWLISSTSQNSRYFKTLTSIFPSFATHLLVFSFFIFAFSFSFFLFFLIL